MPRVPFPIVGGSYNGISPDANPQRAINWYPEYDKTGGRQMLRPTPGMTLLASLEDESLGDEMITNGDFSSATGWTEGSGWTITGGKLVHASGTAGVVSQAAGSMVTAPVVGATYRITFDVDSASAGAFLVGLGGVSYADAFVSSGSQSIDITTTTATGFYMAATIYLAASIDNVSVKLIESVQYPIRGLLPVGDYLYAVYGPYLKKIDSDFADTTLNSNTPMNSTGLVTMSHIKHGDGFQIMICDGTDKVAYIYDTESALFRTMTDIAYEFQGGGSTTSIDGYFLSHGVDTDKFFISDVSQGTSWDAADDSRAWVKTSNIERVYAHNQLVFVFKGDSTEVFYNSGSSGATQPTFARMSGGVINVGTKAPQSIASVKDRLFWLANDRTVQMAIGQSVNTVSSLQLSYQIEQMSTSDDAVSYCYTEDGHDFYVMSFPTADITYVYDATTGDWHERESYDTDKGCDGRHRSNCYAYFQDKHVVGDYANTLLYELDTTVYTDNGSRIIRQRITQNINEENLTEFFKRFEVHFEGGVGAITGQGSSPKAMLRISKDGGHTWSGVLTSTMGARGGYDVRSIWNRLGSGRDFSVWLTVSDPVKAVIVGSWLDYDQGYA